jgi:hypothetical protein
LVKLLAVARRRPVLEAMTVRRGQRKGELASLTVGQLYLDEPTPFAELRAADEMNREAS